MDYSLPDLINIPLFQELLDRLNEALYFPSAIIDNDGNILTATNWQDFCTQFHRAHPESEQECRKSDQYIVDHIRPDGGSVSYRCPHGLVDNATPIVIDGMHLGNFFIGQMLLEKPDLEFFRAQAHKYDFDEKAYLEAVQRVPVLTPEQLERNLRLVKVFTQILANISLDHLKEIKAHKTIAEQEERLRLALTAANQGMWDLDVPSGQAVCNPTYFTMLGYAPDEIQLSLDVFASMLHPDDRLRVLHTLTRYMNDELPEYNVEFRCKTKTGDWRWIQSQGQIMERDHRGAPRRIVGIHMDITGRKQAEDALRESEEMNRTLVQNAPIGISVRDRNGRLLAYNSAWQKIWAIPDLDVQADMTRSRPTLELNERDAYLSTRQADVLKIYRQGGALTIPELKTSARRPGAAEWVAQDFFAIQDKQGAVDRVVILTQDITGRKQHEREMAAVAAISVALRSARSRVEMLPIIADQVANLVPCAIIMLLFFDRSRRDMVLEYVRGEHIQAIGQHVPLQPDRLPDALGENRAYVTHDLAHASLFAGHPDTSHWRTLVEIPLFTSDGPIGFLVVASPAELGDLDVRVLSAISDIAANAIQRSSLYEQTQQRLRQVQILHEIDTVIAGSTDMHLAMNLLVMHAMSQLPSAAMRILLHDAPSRTLRYLCGHGFPGADRTFGSMRLGQCLAGQVILQRSMIEHPDLSEVDESLDQKFWLDAGLVRYYGFPLTSKGRVHGVLEVFCRPGPSMDPDVLDFINTLAQQAAIAIENHTLFNDLQSSNLQLAIAYDATIEGWARALDLRDHDTEGHSQRVATWTVDLASAMGLRDTELVHMRRGALLHDIGKLAIPDTILNKPGPLTQEEWELMRRHPRFAHEMLSSVEYLRPALDIPYGHHEKWDGTGYPRGLKGEQISLAARIFAIVDVWDALCTDRPYRQAWTAEQARAWILRQKGCHFDPNVTDCFMDLLSKMNL